MLEPLAQEGIDFWWTDYQQGESRGSDLIVFRHF